MIRLPLLWLVLASTLLPAQEAKVRLGFIGLHGGVFEALGPAAQGLPLELVYVEDAEIAAGRADVGTCTSVFVQHLRNENKEQYRALFSQARIRNPGIHLVSLTGGGADLKGPTGPLLQVDPQITAYYRSSSRDNLRRLLTYVLHHHAGRSAFAVEPPGPGTSFGFYHPEHAGMFASAQEFLAWSRTRGQDQRPHVAVTVHTLHLDFQQPKVVDALVRALEAEGLCAVAVVDTAEGQDILRAQYEAQMLAFAPITVVHTCHSPDKLEFRQKLDAVHLHSVFFSRQSIAQWEQGDGLLPGDFLFQIATQESLGAIEPQVTAGTRAGGGSGEAMTPIAERVTHLARRTAAWVRLRTTANGDKRVAVFYYDREMGKGELMRGSATGMFLNGPRSLIRVLGKLADAGYTVRDVPRDDEDLVRRMMERGRQVGVWTPETLAQLVERGKPALVPVAKYVEWLVRRVPAAARVALEKQWGPPPGRFMVWRDDRDEAFLVIPRIELGNVVLLPQPLRGEAHDNQALHDRKVPPPHNYVATYFWLQEELHADAMVHFGTHGSEFLLPGKQVGQSGEDWSDLVLGSLPNLNPWILDNLGEVPPVKRRAYAVAIGHLPPPVVSAGLADALQAIDDDIHKWEALEDGALKDTFRRNITRQVRESGLDRDLHLTLPPDTVLDEPQVRAVLAHLHQIQEETTPVSLHVLGEPPRQDLRVSYLVHCLRRGFLDALAVVLPTSGAEALRKAAEDAVQLALHKGITPLDAVRAVGGKVGDALPEALTKGFALAADLDRKFDQAPQEIEALLRALSARFVAPGPGSAPTRNPGAVPTGRNLYVLNPEEIPTRPSWELGKQLAEQVLRDHQRKHGHLPGRVAFDLSPFATFQDFGVMEAQILWLLGCEPVWDEKQLVSDVRVLSRAELGRPRVDVFLSAFARYRDNLESRLLLLDKAVRKVADLDEPDNGVRSHTVAAAARLRGQGLTNERADQLARARIFGNAPGESSNAAFYYLTERSGDWQTREDLIKVYLEHVQFAYTQGAWGEHAPEAFTQAVQDTEVVLRTWFDRTTSPLANRYTWLRGGALALAVKTLTGKEPEFILSDVRDPDRSRPVAAEDALRQEFRVRLLNRKWIEGMKQEGYAGADQIAVMVGNAMGWEAMRAGSVGDDVWKEIKEVYLDDKLRLGVREWMDQANPFARQELGEVLLEAARKGFWRADAATLGAVAAAYAESVLRHGGSGGLRGAGNQKLAAFVHERLTAPGSTAPGSVVQAWLAREVQAVERVASASPAPGSAGEGGGNAPGGTNAPAIVTGQRLAPSSQPERERTPPRTEATGFDLTAWLPVALIAACLAAFLSGASKRS